MGYLVLVSASTEEGRGPESAPVFVGVDTPTDTPTDDINTPTNDTGTLTDGTDTPTDDTIATPINGTSTRDSVYYVVRVVPAAAVVLVVVVLVIVLVVVLCCCCSNPAYADACAACLCVGCRVKKKKGRYQFSELENDYQMQ